jgi:hypothetical protein
MKMTNNFGRLLAVATNRSFGKHFVVLIVLVVLSCPAWGANEIYVTATNSNEILVANLDGSGTPSVLFSNAGFSRGPVGIDLVPQTGLFYYGGGNNAENWVANMDGSGTPTQLPNTVGIFSEHHDNSVDLAGNRIFFGVGNNGVFSGNLDGSGTATMLFSVPSSSGPNGVFYEASSDLIYWADNSSDTLAVGNADGSGTPTVLFDGTDGVEGPRDIQVAGDNLYWVEANTGLVRVGNKDGSGSPTTLYSGRDSPRGIDILGDQLYWVEFGGADQIVRANADGTGTPTVLFSGSFGGFRGIAVVPEPNTFAIASVGLLALGMLRRRRK